MTNTSLTDLVPGGDQPIVDLSKAPLPTRKTLRSRRSLLYQFTRFMAFNMRIMRMVVKGHSG